MLRAEICKLLKEIDRMIGCELMAYNQCITASNTDDLFEGNVNRDALLGIAKIYVAERILRGA